MENFEFTVQRNRVPFERIVDTYGDALVRYAYCFLHDSADAEDAAEDAFVALLIKPRYYSDFEHLKAYLYKIVRNKCMDRLRARKRTFQPLSDYENVFLGDTQHTVDARFENETVYKCMQALLQALPPQYREVLSLTYFDGFSVDEAAACIRQSKKQVYNLLSRAKSALSKLLIQEGIS